MTAQHRMAPTPAPDLTTAEARAELNCGPTKLWDLLNAGELSAYYVGRNLRVTRESIESFKKRKAYVKRGRKPAGLRGPGAA